MMCAETFVSSALRHSKATREYKREGVHGSAHGRDSWQRRDTLVPRKRLQTNGPRAKILVGEACVWADEEIELISSCRDTCCDDGSQPRRIWGKYASSTQLLR